MPLTHLSLSRMIAAAIRPHVLCALNPTIYAIYSDGARNPVQF